MRLISILGMLALLAMAWGLSFNRRKVRLRPVAWGLALQFLFAVIILQENMWSFVGMSLLGLLVILYLFQQDIRNASNGNLFSLALIAGSVALGGLLVLLGGVFNLTWLLVLIIIILILNTWKLRQPTLSRYLGGSFVVTLVAAAVAYGHYGRTIFRTFSEGIANFLNLAYYGAFFLFGNLVNPDYFFPQDTSFWPGFGMQFAFKILPTIIFFGGFMAVLYYLGIMQRIILAMSRFMRWTIGTSGAETLSCSANIVVGQTEAPLLIKPFLPEMTPSELLTVMVGGFATIAGGVLAGYIAMGISAGHLVAASVMSAPAALAVGKLIYPETEHSTTAGDVELPEIESGSNVIEAASRGILDGLKLAVNVGAMLIGFIALIAVADVILNWLDKLIDGTLLNGELVTYTATSGFSPISQEYSGIFPGSLKTLFGSIFRPLAWLMGVSWEHADEVGNLLGIKISLNEFVAYGTLGNYIQNAALDERAQIIATYALCGFANFSSIGIQLGGIGAFIPKRRGELSRIALRAMFGGAIASWLTATVAGILL
ncbi:MAG: NupC/NupG family nucleoside CNT transporter [Fidelibacterota bacterium]|nr:MAG: NupC/NupG family nucleoside CNT transporter [Candidatus Neomarinimicrobiota bacterium]